MQSVGALPGPRETDIVKDDTIMEPQPMPGFVDRGVVLLFYPLSSPPDEFEPCGSSNTCSMDVKIPVMRRNT
jgi:hypothetical protein